MNPAPGALPPTAWTRSSPTRRANPGPLRRRQGRLRTGQAGERGKKPSCPTAKSIGPWKWFSSWWSGFRMIGASDRQLGELYNARGGPEDLRAAKEIFNDLDQKHAPTRIGPSRTMTSSRNAAGRLQTSPFPKSRRSLLTRTRTSKKPRKARPSIGERSASASRLAWSSPCSPSGKSARFSAPTPSGRHKIFGEPRCAWAVG